MVAPERFAETSDSSCIAGAVHTWLFREENVGSQFLSATCKSNLWLVSAWQTEPGTAA